MTISRRGLFGTLFGAIAAGYAAKVVPAYATGGFATNHFEEWGDFAVGEAGPESIMPVKQGSLCLARALNGSIWMTPNEIRISEGLPPIDYVSVAGGCTRDGEDEAAS